MSRKIIIRMLLGLMGIGSVIAAKGKSEVNKGGTAQQGKSEAPELVVKGRSVTPPPTGVRTATPSVMAASPTSGASTTNGRTEEKVEPPSTKLTIITQTEGGTVNDAKTGTEQQGTASKRTGKNDNILEVTQCGTLDQEYVDHITRDIKRELGLITEKLDEMVKVDTKTKAEDIRELAYLSIAVNSSEIRIGQITITDFADAISKLHTLIKMDSLALCLYQLQELVKKAYQVSEVKEIYTAAQQLAKTNSKGNFSALYQLEPGAEGDAQKYIRQKLIQMYLYYRSIITDPNNHSL